jgi:hypothetical protein
MEYSRLGCRNQSQINKGQTVPKIGKESGTFRKDKIQFGPHDDSSTVVRQMLNIQDGGLSADEKIGKDRSILFRWAILPEALAGPPSGLETEVDSFERLQILINTFL